MADIPTRAELFDVGLREVEMRGLQRPEGQRLSREAVLLPGTDINIILAGASAMGDDVTRAMCEQLGALFLDSAEGEDLVRLVADRFSPTVVKKEASPALVTLSITRSAGTLPATTLNVGTKVRTENGVEFELTSPISMPAGDLGPQTGDAQATETGLLGNVLENTITQFLQTPADPNLIVTNPDVSSGGDDEETDPRLRDRAREFFTQARRGTLAAIEFGALTVNGVVQATAFELVDSDGLPNGFVQVAIADQQGQANEALATAVELALVEFRAAGIVVDVLRSVPRFVTIEYILRFEAGVNTTAAFDQIQALTVAALQNLNPGETLEVALLISILKSVRGVIVLEDAVAQPLGDVVPLPNESLRTRTDLVTSTPP